MDVAGLVVGLGGLVSVFEASCKVWRNIRAASGFGDDVADSIRKLEMEFFRFYTWWDVLRSLELRKVCPYGLIFLHRMRAPGSGNNRWLTC